MKNSSKVIGHESMGRNKNLSVINHQSSFFAESKAAFTLIEMLVVIAIIGVLAGLLFPAINASRNAARKTQAKTEIRSILTAMKAFESEYGYPPVADKGDLGGNDKEYIGGNGELIDVLRASTINISEADLDDVNPRGYVFLEIEETKLKDADGTLDGEFRDPWKEGSYSIIIDADFSGDVQHADINDNDALSVMAAVWCETPDGKIIGSWE